MQFSCDRTGFPLIAVPSVGLEVQLLPVTKIQFERFLAEPNDFGDMWYEEVLRFSPRVSLRQFVSDNRERLFITGLLPEEALAFARWMGDGLDVPTVDQWRAIYTALKKQRPPVPHSLLPSLAGPARVVLEKLKSQLQADSLWDLSLMHNGVIEWARQRNTWVGLGAPRLEFHRNLFNPLSDEVRPIRAGGRLPYFGLRLVRGIASQAAL